MYRQGTSHSFRLILTCLNTDISQFTTLKVLFILREHIYILLLTYFQFIKDLLYRVTSIDWILLASYPKVSDFLQNRETTF